MKRNIRHKYRRIQTHLLSKWNIPEVHNINIVLEELKMSERQLQHTIPRKSQGLDCKNAIGNCIKYFFTFVQYLLII